LQSKKCCLVICSQKLYCFVYTGIKNSFYGFIIHIWKVFSSLKGKNTPFKMKLPNETLSIQEINWVGEIFSDDQKSMISAYQQRLLIMGNK
jgi:hypothetical protein